MGKFFSVQSEERSTPITFPSAPTTVQVSTPLQVPVPWLIRHLKPLGAAFLARASSVEGEPSRCGKAVLAAAKNVMRIAAENFILCEV